MQEAGASLLSLSPSFNSYSSQRLADIAARVIEELHRDSDHSLSSDHINNTCPALHSSCKSDADYLSEHEDSHGDGNCDVDAVLSHEEQEDEDFEFAFVSRDENSSPISADEIFYNGQIRPVYPIFDQSLLVDYARNDNGKDSSSDSGSLRLTAALNETGQRRRRPPLKELMFEERGAGSCSSSVSDSDDVELDGVEPGTYCVWNPKSVATRDPSCKKSKSTGTTSKRWKLRDLLLLRSQSDGKDSLLLVSHSQSKRTPSTTISSNCKANKEAAKETCAGDDVVTKKEVDEKAKRKTMLPYRPHIVGLLFQNDNANGVVGRNIHPF